MPKGPQDLRPEDRNMPLWRQVAANEEMHAFRALLEALETGRERWLLSDGRDDTQAKIAELRESIPYLEAIVRFYTQKAPDA
jgi:hypothetical protein